MGTNNAEASGFCNPRSCWGISSHIVDFDNCYVEILWLPFFHHPIYCLHRNKFLPSLIFKSDRSIMYNRQKARINNLNLLFANPASLELPVSRHLINNNCTLNQWPILVFNNYVVLTISNKAYHIHEFLLPHICQTVLFTSDVKTFFHWLHSYYIFCRKSLKFAWRPTE